MASYALYRLPHAGHCTLVRQLSGVPVELSSCADLSGCRGFLMAPFAPSEEQPILLIRPDEVEQLSMDADFHLPEASLPASVSSPSPYRDNYHVDFLNFHSRLVSGDFQKLVLSRCLDVARPDQATPEALFRQACERYPRMIISLVCTPKSGLWLMATPEVLLSGSGNEWLTIALAGTMPYADDVRWGDKDIQEQRYVATYITEQLEQFTSNFTESGPYTARAGHLAHLRSDFRFMLNDERQVGELLRALHPTPAVCGLPKQQAFRFILQNEHHRRSYYSGFMGPLFLDGQTHLYVSLRCMQLFATHYRLYAGGGLLADSVEELEWQETETKLDTMRNLIAHV